MNMTRTTNGALAHATTGSALLDYFNKVGASRGQDISDLWTAAYQEDSELAMRLALYSRDIRGGVGERQHFRDVLRLMANCLDDADLSWVIEKTPEVGRWDDLLTLIDSAKSESVMKGIAAFWVASAAEGNKLAAKWLPRKGIYAKMIADAVGLSPKQYRKLIVKNSETVEQQMCAGDWDSINLSHVPSMAWKLYTSAFRRHLGEKFSNHVEAAIAGKVGADGKVAKVNAGAIFPVEIVASLAKSYTSCGAKNRAENLPKSDEVLAAEAQWKALPDYMNGEDVAVIVDTSGSMIHSHATTTRPIDVAVALGIYCAERNSGVMKDKVLSFSSWPSIIHLDRNASLAKRVKTLFTYSDWGGTTNVIEALRTILNIAKEGGKIPSSLLIISDMQFNGGVYAYPMTTHEDAQREYSRAGLRMPNIVYWNVADGGNAQAAKFTNNAKLVSGYSPAAAGAVLKTIAGTPYDAMVEVLMSDRYARPSNQGE